MLYGLFKLTHSTRNTPAYEIELGSLRLFVSYQEIIGARLVSDVIVRVNNWGRTTGKHYGLFGIGEHPRLSDDEFELRLCLMLASAAEEISVSSKERADELAARLQKQRAAQAEEQKEEIKEKRVQTRKEANRQLWECQVRARASGLAPFSPGPAMLDDVLAKRKPETMWKRLIKAGFPTLTYRQVLDLHNYLKNGSPGGNQ